MNSTGVKTEDDVKGFRAPVPGRYHVVVKHVDDSFTKGDALIVEFEVLAGTIPGQEGLTQTERMFLRDGQSSDQHLRFALVTALIQPGTEADVNFQHAIGRQLVIGLEKRPDKKDPKKEYTNIAEYGMAMWSLNNPEVRDVPRLAPPGQRQQQAPPQQTMPMIQHQAQPQQQPYYQQTTQPQYAPLQQQQPAGGGGGWSDI